MAVLRVYTRSQWNMALIYEALKFIGEILKLMNSILYILYIVVSAIAAFGISH